MANRTDRRRIARLPRWLGRKFAESLSAVKKTGAPSDWRAGLTPIAFAPRATEAWVSIDKFFLQCGTMR